MEHHPDNLDAYVRSLRAGALVGEPDPRLAWVDRWTAAEFTMVAALVVAGALLATLPAIFSYRRSVAAELKR